MESFYRTEAYIVSHLNLRWGGGVNNNTTIRVYLVIESYTGTYYTIALPVGVDGD